jgi:hypothetical protein
MSRYLQFRNLTRPGVLLLLLWLPVGLPSALAQQEQVVSAEQSFTFIASTLQAYNRDGRIEEEIGIGQDRLQDFIDLLTLHYREFTEGFSPTSNFCNFYRDPDNGLIEIEERAVLAFQYLPALPRRVERFINVDQQFMEQLEGSFGAAVLASVDRLKTQARHFEYLPAGEMYGEDMINFADTACR